MKYSSYKARMQKIRKVMDFFYRLRFVFLGIVVVITSSLLALSIAKGSITEVSTFEISYRYGEDITYSGSAFMGEVSFEFRKKGEQEWSEEKPKYVGDYEVRAKCKGNYGNKYSSVSTFSIDPIEAPITIKNNHIDYGDDHPPLTYQLLSGDRINDDYKVNYEDLSANTTTALLDLSTIQIFDSDNVDVTNCYTLSTEEKEVTFNKSIINIKFDDNIVKKYDGGSYTNDGWEHTSGNLYYDGEIVVDNGITATEIGTYQNQHRVRVMKDDVDYSANYDIRYNDNSIRIDKSPAITIATNPLSKTYDGKPFAIGERVDVVDESGLTITEGEFNATVTGLLPIHHIEVEFTNAEVKNAVGGIKNEISYRILDKDDNDVEDHYENVIVSKGDMGISLRPVTFTTEDYEGIYNAKEQYNKNYTITEGKLADDEYEVLQDNYAKRIYVGEQDNTQSFKIYHRVEDGDPIDVTANYDVSTVYGKISIGQRSVSITSGDVREQFDNTEKYNKAYEYEESDLADGDYIKLDDYTKQTTPVEDLDNEHKYKIYHHNETEGEEDLEVTSNYDIKTIAGKINIFTEPLEFEFEEQEFEYDDKDHNYYTNGNKATLKEEFKKNLPKDFTYEVTLIPQGEEDDLDKYKKMHDYVEDGYTAKEEDVVVKIFDAKGKDVAEYYEADKIKVDIPTSTITKKKATVTVEDYEEDFNNKTLEDSVVLDRTKVGSKISATGLVTGHNLKVDYEDKSDDSPKNKKKYSEVDKPYRLNLTYSIENSKGDKVGSNYDIEFKDEKNYIDATINKRVIHLEAKDVRKVYDEKNTFVPEVKKPTEGYDGGIGKDVEKIIVDPEKIEAEKYRTLVDEHDDEVGTGVGDYDYNLTASDVKIYIGNKATVTENEDVTENYQIIFGNNAKVTIDPRPVTITNEIDKNTHPVEMDGFQYLSYDKKNHGVYKTGDTTTSAEIKIEEQDDEKETGLIDGHTMTFEYEAIKQEPDDYVDYYKDPYVEQPGKVVFGTQVWNKKGHDVTDNYQIIHDTLQFKIKKTRIDIESKNAEHDFDWEKFDDVKFIDFDFNEFYDYQSLSDLYKVTFSNHGSLPALQTNHHLMLTKYDEASAENALDYKVDGYDYTYEAKVFDFTGLKYPDDLETVKNDPERDVSDLYTISPTYEGKLFINPVKIRFSTKDKGITYDSLGHNIFEADCGVSYEITENGSPTFVQNFSIGFDYYESAGFDGESTVSNFFKAGSYTVDVKENFINTKTGTQYLGGGIISEFANNKDYYTYSISARVLTIVERKIGTRTMRYIANGSLAGSDRIEFDGGEGLYNQQWHTYTSDLSTAKIYRGEKDVTTSCYHLSYAWM